MTVRPQTRFSVYYSTPLRALLAMISVLLFVVGASLAVFRPDLDEPGEEEWLLGVAALPLVTVLLLLEVVLFDIRLRTDVDRLVKRGVWRSSVDLRTASFRLTETTWQNLVRLGPLNVKRFNITAPTLVVRSGLRRIKLPLARRFGHPVVNGQLTVSWLPEDQLGALADAIERSATAENKAKVVTYLRQIRRSSVKPLTSTEAIL